MKVDEEEEFRKIAIRADATKSISSPNRISTTKYSLLSWLPKSLWEQFRRVANVYFLLISILMLIGEYAPTLWQTPLDPYSTVVTLLFVLLVTSIKEGMEDVQRAKSDRFENNKEVTVVTFSENGSIKETIVQSQFISPGDIIKLSGHMAAPVDLIIILTSMYSDGNKCYIETANIDGETNLKLREAPAMLIDCLGDKISSGIPVPELFKGTIEFQQPNKNIHTFIGTLHLNSTTEAIPLSAENLILRSCLFSNTDWGYGIAVYTGQETKIQMNNRHAASKMSTLEGYLNMAIIIIFWSQCILVSISVISIYILGFNNFDAKIPYVYPNGEGSGSILPLWLEQWIVFFLLYNNFIPISLYVTIELVNVGQASLIASDLLMYQEDLDVPCAVKSSNLVQELGQVSNIFSDKTGTLTKNEMKLVKFIIDGRMYDIAVNAIPLGQSPILTSTQKNASDSSFNSGNDMKVENLSNGGEDNKSISLKSGAVIGSPSETMNERLMDFLRCLTTCHTVVREKSGVYRAESPDELALVEGVAGYRCGLRERSTKEMNIELCGQLKTYEIFAVNPFNSDRKRMSILLRDTQGPPDEYLVLCKGADNIMLPLCSSVMNDPHQHEEINQSLLELSNFGLRTLIVAQKKLTEAEAQRWLRTFREANVSTTNRDENIANAGAELETDLTLVGITAIEDCLQDEVPEVIADLAKAGIVLWMLTGDKVETAINIARSCNLLLPNTELSFMTNVKNSGEFGTRMREEYDKIAKKADSNNALVIDGPSLTHFDDKDQELRVIFIKIGQLCRSVVACRLTPTQKRELVALVKKETKPRAITLSIGDGANDVSMILEADVGVGIYGKEGRQAANNADFAIGEFKFLRRLLLVHGRWNYIRQSRVFLYSMHKNMVITLTLFWFSYFDAVSGTSLYESWIYTSFNFALGLPIIFYGILDRDLSESYVLSNPKTYITGQRNVYLRPASLAMWILNAIEYAVVICLVFYYVTYRTFMYDGLYVSGTTVFTGLVMALQAKVAFLHHQWAYPQIVAMCISVFCLLIYYLIISSSSDDYWYVGTYTMGQGIFWYYGMFSVPLIAVFIDVLGYCFYLFFRPTPEMVFREMEHQDIFCDPYQRLTCLRKRSDSTESNREKLGPQQRSASIDMTILHAENVDYIVPKSSENLPPSSPRHNNNIV